ncbi:MAG: glycosyltransferase family 4 protein, partial [Caldilineales bacterium]|nr:glycosyltransferase family 4 protein [Caldilineales bacterium]
LRGLARSLGIADAVEFLGWAAPEQIPDLINRSTLVLAPSRWEEPFGLVALEAAQMGRPVIATNVGGLPEIVLHGETGLLVERDDIPGMAAAISELLGQPDRCGAMGGRARLRAAADFGITRMVDAYDSVYRRMRKMD